MDFDALLKEASRYESQLRAHRRALHHIPELGYEEHETHAYLMEHLRALAPDDLKTFARTGIRAVFRGDGTGRVIAFRSDIDALPIQEATGRDYASCHSGQDARLRPRRPYGEFVDVCPVAQRASGEASRRRGAALSARGGDDGRRAKHDRGRRAGRPACRSCLRHAYDARRAARQGFYLRGADDGADLRDGFHHPRIGRAWRDASSGTRCSDGDGASADDAANDRRPQHRSGTARADYHRPRGSGASAQHHCRRGEGWRALSAHSPTTCTRGWKSA